MGYPSDPHFPVCDEDAEFLSELGALPLRPVFIMGLHRSGTTFLCDCIAKSFPLANLSLYHLFYYQRLLRNHRDGTTQRDVDRLNECFRAQGIEDRKLDSVPVNAEEVEEYGFLLRRHCGSFKLGPDNAALFAQLCQKLLAVQPGSQAVLLKNPWDTGNAAWILKRFPEARFVYITREPIAVLNSMLNALQAYLDGPQAYLEMLLSRDGSRRGYRLGFAAWQLLRGIKGVLGQRRVARLFRPLLARTVVSQVAAYRADLASLPANRAVEIDYAKLVEDPVAVMTQLQSLLDLPLSGAAQPRAVRQRRDINPVLNGYESRLEQLLSRAAGA